MIIYMYVNTYVIIYDIWLLRSIHHHLWLVWGHNGHNMQKPPWMDGPLPGGVGRPSAWRGHGHKLPWPWQIGVGRLLSIQKVGYFQGRTVNLPKGNGFFSIGLIINGLHILKMDIGRSAFSIATAVSSISSIIHSQMDIINGLVSWKFEVVSGEETAARAAFSCVVLCNQAG